MLPIDRNQLHQLHEREKQRFVADHPHSAALYQRAQSSLLGGVPMNWMKKWAGAFPRLRQIRQRRALHRRRRPRLRRPLPRRHRRHDRPLARRSSPKPSLAASAKASRSCFPPKTRSGSAKISSAASACPYWQFTLTATDANRFSIRIAREITQRPKILVFHYCYHGTVDESFATLARTAQSVRAAATSARP